MSIMSTLWHELVTGLAALVHTGRRMINPVYYMYALQGFSACVWSLVVRVIAGWSFAALHNSCKDTMWVRALRFFSVNLSQGVKKFNIIVIIGCGRSIQDQKRHEGALLLGFWLEKLYLIFSLQTTRSLTWRNYQPFDHGVGLSRRLSGGSPGV